MAEDGQLAAQIDLVEVQALSKVLGVVVEDWGRAHPEMSVEAVAGGVADLSAKVLAHTLLRLALPPERREAWLAYYWAVVRGLVSVQLGERS